MTEHIRWTSEPEITSAACSGYAGTFSVNLFRIYAPDESDDRWILASLLPGAEHRSGYGGSAEELKPIAERLLLEFVTSLGASFPEDAGREREDVLRKFAPPAPSRPAEHIAPLETGEPWRGPAQADWDGSR